MPTKYVLLERTYFLYILDQTLRCLHCFNYTAPCIGLAPLRRGKIEYRMINGEQEARFSCNRGHSMEKGNPTLKCVNGTWNGVSPVCRGECST